MSLTFSAPDATSYMSYSAGSFTGNSAHSLVFLANNNTVASAVNMRCMSWMASSTEQNCLLMDASALFGNNDFSSGVTVTTASTKMWRLYALTKVAGTATFRCHYWDYASDGSGTMTHAVAAGAGTHADQSTATTCRVGWAADLSAAGDIAVAAYWNRALSDADLDTLKSSQLSAWNALAPDLGVHYSGWTGTGTDTVFAGTSGTGTINGTQISNTTGADPSGFNFALTSFYLLNQNGYALSKEDGTFLLKE